ncbi:DUF3332 family protein [Puteibacter caeruleilacunae]|nr:DUF3332 family protein [Puteibacter caeruleilacunae]
MKSIRIIFVACALILGAQSCYGPFQLTRNLHEWNGTVGDKFTNSLVFFAFVVIPVYEVTILVDGVVLNTIEFWTGNNPIAMKEGEVKTKKVRSKGNTYLITASHCRYDIEIIAGDASGQKATLIYEKTDESWNLLTPHGLKKLVRKNNNKLEKSTLIDIFRPDGTFITLNAETTSAQEVQQLLMPELLTVVE